MLTLRKANARGHAQHGWLDSHHTFSFAEYHDPEHMGFSVLRVINEDWIDGGQGFDLHPHKDMEIITYVLEGALEHQDSMGNSTIIRPGEVQRMSAGTGIRHSEINHSKDQKTHLLQIWILPAKKGIQPSYGQKSFTAQLGLKEFVLVASQTGREDSVSLNQNVDLFIGKAKAKREFKHLTQLDRHLWVQVAHGKVTVNGTALDAGDGLAISEETEILLKADTGSEFLLFDMP